MPRWKIISGSRAFHSFPNRPSLAIGWARDLERGEKQVTLNVCVPAETQDAHELPAECRDAIRSHGRSVVNALLNEDELPWVVDVTLTGLEREYRLEPEDEEDEDEDEDEDEEDADGVVTGGDAGESEDEGEPSSEPL